MKSELREYISVKKTYLTDKLPSWSNKDGVQRKVAVIPVVNIEIYTKFGLSIQPHLNKNTPDVANIGWRDYGNRYGLPRLIKIFESLNIPFECCINADILTQEPFVWEVLEKCKVPFSFTAHGINNTFQLPTNDPLKEKIDFSNEYVKETLDIIEKHTNRRPKSWLSPGFSLPWYLPEVLEKQGVLFSMDCTDDEHIYQKDGGKLMWIPYTMETNDVSLIVSKQYDNRAYEEAIYSLLKQLHEESVEKPPMVVCIGLHPFIAGTPGRAQFLENALKKAQADFNSLFFTHTDQVLSIINKE